MPTNNTVSNDVIKIDVNIFLAFLASFLGLSAILLNLLLVYVIYRTKILHTCTNGFIVSLSLAELLVAMFAIPFAAVSRVSGSWVFSNSFCTASGFMYNVGRNGSAYSLMLVCVDRCVAVSKPLKYNNIMTRRCAAILTALAWSLSVLIAMVPFFGKGMYTFIVKFSLCMLLGDHNSAHMFFKETFGCLLPATVILISVLKIVKESKSHHRVFAAVPLPVNVQGPSRTPNYGRTTLKAMRALFVIIMSYALFCIPLSVVKIMSQMCCQTLPETIVTSFVWLSFLCCAINPVVIATMNKKFKQSFVSIVCRCVTNPRSDCMEKEGFTITSGLHTVLDASLVVSVIQNSEKGLRRHKLTKARTKQEVSFPPTLTKPVVRRTQSTPECPVAGTSGQ